MDNISIARKVYETFARRDVPALLAMFDENIEWRLAEGHPYSPDGAMWIGREAIARNFFMRAGADWDEFAIAPQRFHDAGDRIVVECRYSGTCKATHKRLDAQVCHIWTLADGMVTGFQQYIDTAHLQDVMRTPITHRAVA